MRVAALIAFVMVVLPAGVARAEQPPGPAEIDVVFDKPTYRSGDLVKASLTVTNTGLTRRDFYVDLWSLDNPDELAIVDGWGHAEPLYSAVPIDPGSSYTATISGYTRRPDAELVNLKGVVMEKTSNGGHGNLQFSRTVPVVKTLTPVGGIAFADEDGDGRPDPGEHLPGIAVHLMYQHGPTGQAAYTTTTDSAGRFTFPALPTVHYYTVNTRLNGWVMLSRSVHVRQSGGNDAFELRAVKPLSGQLKAAMVFDKEIYKRGEQIKITVTLTNTSAHPLIGIVAYCNRGGWDDGLYGTTPGWGDLNGSWSAGKHPNGATIPANQARTFEVSDTVPERSFETSRLFVACEFAYAGFDDAGNQPFAHDEAEVPGGRGTLKGVVAYHPEGEGPGKPREPVAGVKVILVDKRSCRVGETVTGADGKYALVDVPTANFSHSLYFFPPAGWTINTQNPWTRVEVWHGTERPIDVPAGKGQAQLPVLPAPTPACGQQSSPVTTTTPTTTSVTTRPVSDQTPNTPAPQGKAVTELAKTGADVAPLAGIGVLTLFAGIGTVLATRRPARAK